MPSKASRKTISKKSTARKGSKKASKKASKRSKKTCAVKRVSSYEGTCEAGMTYRRGYCKPSSGKYVRGSCVRIPKPYTGPYIMTPQGMVIPQGQVMKQESVVMTPQGPVVMEQVKAEMPAAQEVALDVFANTIASQIQREQARLKPIAEKLAFLRLNQQPIEKMIKKAEQEGNLKAQENYMNTLEEMTKQIAPLEQQEREIVAKIAALQEQQTQSIPAGLDFMDFLYY